MAARRWRLQFSLLTLLLLALLAGAGMTLWLHWQPWYLETTLRVADYVQHAAFAADSAHVVAHDDSTVYLYDIRTGDFTKIAALSGVCEKIEEQCSEHVMIAELTPDQQYIVVVSLFKLLSNTVMEPPHAPRIRIYDRAGKVIGSLPAERAGSVAIRISDDSKQLLTIDDHPRVWSLPDGATLGVWMPVANDHAIDAYFQNDQAIVLSEAGGNDHALKLRAIRSPAELSIPLPHAGLNAVVSRDGARILTWNRNPPELYIWDTSSGKLLISSKRAKSETINLSCERAVFLGDGRVLASLYSGAAAERGDLWLWNPDANSSLAIASGGYSGYDEVFASPDGRRIVTRKAVTQIADHFDHMRMWDATNGMPLFDFTTPAAILLDRPQPRDTTIEFSPDGGRFLSYSEISPTVQIWRRRRPEYAWGIVALPEFWITVVLSIALIWNVTRRLRNRRASANGSVL